MTTAKALRYSLGVSLIEVLITLLVFTVGMLGFAALQLNALQSTGDSAQRSQSVWILQELAERMRSNPEAGAANYTAAVNCANLPANRCADYYDPVAGAKVNAAVCTAAQLAAFDRWEAQCPYSATGTYQANATAAAGRYASRDFLSQPASGTPLNMVASGTTVIITANWLSKADKRSDADSLTGTVEVVR